MMWRPHPAPYRRGVDAINELIFQATASPWLLLVMFAVAAIDGFFPPVPSETVLVAGAAVAASAGSWHTVLLLGLAAALGAVLGDNIAYAIGRKVGSARFRWMRRPRVAAAFAGAQAALTHRGAPLVLGARYIPVGRVAVNMSAGALRYPHRRFFRLTVFAGISWAIYGVLIGTVAGQWLRGQPLLGATLGALFAIIVGILIDRIAAARRRRTASAAAAAAVPEAAPELIATGGQPVIRTDW